jgi:hypothetical protein
LAAASVRHPACPRRCAGMYSRQVS